MKLNKKLLNSTEMQHLLTQMATKNTPTGNKVSYCATA